MIGDLNQKHLEAMFVDITWGYLFSSRSSQKSASSTFGPSPSNDIQMMKEPNALSASDHCYEAPLSFIANSLKHNTAVVDMRIKVEFR
jgi:hypothetical protein